MGRLYAVAVKVDDVVTAVAVAAVAAVAVAAVAVAFAVDAVAVAVVTVGGVVWREGCVVGLY